MGVEFNPRDETPTLKDAGVGKTLADRARKRPPFPPPSSRTCSNCDRIE